MGIFPLRRSLLPLTVGIIEGMVALVVPPAGHVGHLGCSAQAVLIDCLAVLAGLTDRLGCSALAVPTY